MPSVLFDVSRAESIRYAQGKSKKVSQETPPYPAGETAQALHRDDSLYPIQNAGMELQIGVMWALDDFTAENGGARVVLGSHRFLRSWHLPDVSDILASSANAVKQDQANGNFAKLSGDAPS